MSLQWHRRMCGSLQGNISSKEKERGGLWCLLFLTLKNLENTFSWDFKAGMLPLQRNK